MRVSALALAVATAIVVTACGSSNSSGGASASSGGGTAVAASHVSGAPSWCGSKKITLGLADGFGDNNWRKITVGEARAEAKLCPSITKFVYTDGQGNTQKAISDIQSDVAQGVNALVVFPDAGKAVLPAITQAYKAGLVVVPYRVFPGGQAGVNYTKYVSTNFAQAGQLWGQFLDSALKCKGNIINLGGPPANTQSLEEYQGLKAATAKCPGIHIIGQTPYYVINWDPATTQQVLTAVLAKYPTINAITTDFGSALASSVSAFTQANRQLPTIATEDANQLSCLAAKQKKSDPSFQLFTVDSQNWMVRIALDYAVAKATGGKIPSTNVPQKAFEDSLTGKPHNIDCDPSMPSDAILSSHLTHAAQLAALGQTGYKG